MGRRFAAVLGIAALALAACGQAASSRPVALPAPHSVPRPHSSRVITIVMENEEATSVIGSHDAPYTNALARRGGLATRSYAIRHPSLPNYLALTSGSTQGVTSDCTDCHTAARSIASQLLAARISWRAYEEDLPHPCFTGGGADDYAKKHDPFLYYDAIVRDRSACRAHVVGFGALGRDLRRGRLPTYTFITPNLCHDGHDCGVAEADRFLRAAVPPLLRALGPHGYLVLTWDEGDSDAGCCGSAHGGRIATIVVGPDVRRGGREAAPVDHYGVLATVEDSLRLPRLGAAAAPQHGSLRPLFTRFPRLR
jgi:phosphatidylinositol-3-phosphatase